MGCDGSGHANGSFQSHRSVSGCPRASIIIKRAQLSPKELTALQIKAQAGEDLEDDDALRELDQEIEELRQANAELEARVSSYRSEVSARELEVIQVTSENEATEKRIQSIEDSLTCLQDELIQTLRGLLKSHPGILETQELSRDTVYDVVSQLKDLSTKQENSPFASAFRSAMAQIKVN